MRNTAIMVLKIPAPVLWREHLNSGVPEEEEIGAALFFP